MVETARFPCEAFRNVKFQGVSSGVTHGVKHAYPDVWKRRVDKARGDAQWKGNTVQFLGSSIESDEGVGRQVGRAFIYYTEEI